jgi:peptidoglycan/xylan/chitin deacetylase (PgdA/CDA1 family)
VARRTLPGRAVLLTFDDGYADFADHAAPILCRHDFGAVINLVTDRVGQTNEWDEGDLPLMSWEAVRELCAMGFSFGAHTATHPKLTDLSVEAVVREASRARSTLTEKLGRPPETFAYPYGFHDEPIAHLVGGCGFSFGLLAGGGPASFRHDLLSLPRIEITGDDDLATFARKVGLPGPGTDSEQGTR